MLHHYHTMVQPHHLYLNLSWPLTMFSQLHQIAAVAQDLLQLGAVHLQSGLTPFLLATSLLLSYISLSLPPSCTRVPLFAVAIC